MAINSINGIGWFAAGVVVALGCYTASNQVAAQRDRLASVDRSIAQAQSDIRMLDAEFATRANISQLERWNGELMRLSAPRAGQIVSGDVAMASLDADDAGAKQADAGYLVVPEAVKPAMRASADVPVADDAAPARMVRAAAVSDAAAPPAAKAVPTEKVALLDRKLLRDTSFSDLMRGARGADVQ